MKCPKCNHDMKEYNGLFETGWDCVNEFCGNETHDLALDARGNVITPGPDKEKTADFIFDADAFKMLDVSTLVKEMLATLDRHTYESMYLCAPTPPVPAEVGGKPDELFMSPETFHAYARAMDVSIPFNYSPNGTHLILSLSGDGSDGDIELRFGTTYLTRDMQFNSLVLHDGVELKLNGFKAEVRETLELRGSSQIVEENEYEYDEDEDEEEYDEEEKVNIDDTLSLSDLRFDIENQPKMLGLDAQLRESDMLDALRYSVGGSGAGGSYTVPKEAYLTKVTMYGGGGSGRLEIESFMSGGEDDETKIHGDGDR